MPQRNRKPVIALSIRDGIRRQIESGAFSPGSTLPSENSLCQEFGASRMTVRAALKLLAADGLIVSRPGRGWELVSTEVRPLHAVDKPVLLIAGESADATQWLDAAQSELVHAGLSIKFHRFTSPWNHLNDFDWTSVSAAIFFRGFMPEDSILAATREAGVVIVGIMLTSDADFDRVAPDHHQGTIDILQNLQEAGCNRIAYLSVGALEHGHDDSFAERRHAYDHFVAANGLEALPFMAAQNSPYDLEGGARFREWAKEKRPDGLFATTGSVMGFGLLQLAEAGLNAGSDIQVAVADRRVDRNALNLHDVDSVPYVGPALAELGQAAARRVIARLSGDDSPAVCVRIPCEIGQTCGVLPG